MKAKIRSQPGYVEEPREDGFPPGWLEGHTRGPARFAVRTRVASTNRGTHEHCRAVSGVDGRSGDASAALVEFEPLGSGSPTTPIPPTKRGRRPVRRGDRRRSGAATSRFVVGCTYNARPVSVFVPPSAQASTIR
jgi:hypothetical protein